MKILLPALILPLLLAACAADRPSGENGFYGEIKTGVETSHRH